MSRLAIPPTPTRSWIASSTTRIAWSSRASRCAATAPVGWGWIPGPSGSLCETIFGDYSDAFHGADRGDVLEVEPESVLDVIDAVGAAEVEGEALETRSDAWVDPDLAGVLAHGAVADTVVVVLGAPVPTNGLGVKAAPPIDAVGDVPRDLDRGFVAPPGAWLPFAHAAGDAKCDARMRLPPLQAEPRPGIEHLHAPRLLPAALHLVGCFAGLDWGGRDRQSLNRLQQSLLVVLDLHQDVTADSVGRLEGLHLAVQRIEGVEPILEAQLQDEVLRHRDLVGLLVDVDVREDDAPNRAEQAQDLPHPLVRGGVGAALQRRAVDGCRLLVNPFAHETICFEGRGMDAERSFEALRAKASEQVSQLALADRRLHVAGEVRLQHREMLSDERRHALVAVRPAQVTQNTEQQNLRQRVPFPLGPARVGNIDKNIQ